MKRTEWKRFLPKGMFLALVLTMSLWPTVQAQTCPQLCQNVYSNCLFECPDTGDLNEVLCIIGCNLTFLECQALCN